MIHSEDFLLSTYDYELPEELIAKVPVLNRDGSRMMVVGRNGIIQAHKNFYQLKDYLKPGDVLVMNETKVINARLYVQRETGAKVEIFFLKNIFEKNWQVLTKCGSKLKIGEKFYKNKTEVLKLLSLNEDGTRTVEWLGNENLFTFLEKQGEPPLPPYIVKSRIKEIDNESKIDIERYQTVYATQYGAVAAPTAGLHFTPQLINELETNGIKIVKLILHVGYGTFVPVKANDIRQHQMHYETYELNQESADVINHAKKVGNRIVAVGTTSGRTLETCAIAEGELKPQKGETNIFIYPGYKFKIIDGMITNFHLPKSSLIMYISAFTDRMNLLNSYSEAIKLKYRFYSYGDCMLII